jgi:hypothetical protein
MMSDAPLQGKVKRWHDMRSEEAYLLARMGHTEDEIAFAMQVHPKTIPMWKRTKPEFALALAKGKSEVDSKVQSALLMCALGYSYVEQVAQTDKKTGKITLIDVNKYKGPESWAAVRWLTTRMPEWNETHKIVIENNHNININLAKADLSMFTMDDMIVLEKLGLSKMIGQGAQDIEAEETDGADNNS